jgi:hypothetical protein
MADKKKKVMHTIFTPEFRVSYPSVLKARKVNESDPDEKAKFSIQMLFQVKETEKSKKAGRPVVSLKPIKDMVALICQENLGPDWATKIKERKGDDSPKYKLPFRSGGTPEKKDLDGYGEGVEFFTASSKDMPGLVGPKADPADPRKSLPLENPEREFYGGCIARAQINPYWFTFKNKQGVVISEGVAIGLLNVQKIRDDEPFSSRTKAEDAFAPIEEPTGGAMPAASTGDPLGAL